MEHWCGDCDEVIINNKSYIHYCPKCGKHMYRLCDEVFDNEICYDEEYLEQDYQNGPED